MTKYILMLFIGVTLLSCGKKNSNGTKIDWIDNLEGNYSFTENWSYKDYVHENSFGQLVCDGLCDPRTDKMKDEDGRIFSDSLSRYYQLVDTTHINYSIENESNAYGWVQTNNVIVNRTDTNTIEAYTICDGGNYSSLHLTFKDNICIPVIESNSPVASEGKKSYKCKDGYIKIDKVLWEKGILKAEFDFSFDDPDNKEKNTYWKGKIYSQIL